MRTPATFFLTILISCMSLVLIGCGYDVVETKEIVKLRSAESELAKLKEENARLAQEVASLKTVGRYQIHQNGFRTWRLNTATGQDCLLLTSKEDWKKLDTVMQGCPSRGESSNVSVAHAVAYSLSIVPSFVPTTKPYQVLPSIGPQR